MVDRSFALLRRLAGVPHGHFVERWRAARAGWTNGLCNIVDQSPPESFPPPSFDGIEIGADMPSGIEALADVLDPLATTFVRARRIPILESGFGPVKFMSLLRRKEGMTQKEFSDYWTGNHAPLVISILEVSNYFKGYVQNHCISGTQHGLGTSADVKPVDGIVEIWFRSLADLERAMFSSTYMGRIREDEAKFVALPNRRMLVMEELAD